MAKHNSLSELFTDIADSIRAKTGGTDTIVADDFPEAIEAIVAGSGGSNEEWIGDGNTHLWITLPEGRTSPVLGVGVNGTVTVDWGDGTETDVLKGTSVYSVTYTPNHVYAKAGDYVITLSGECTLGILGTYTRSNLLNASDKSAKVDFVYRNAIRKVELGDNVTQISTYAFMACQSLTHITLPDGITQLTNAMFDSCYGLESIIIPNGVTRIGDNTFQGCCGLTSIVIPDSVTYIGSSAFSSCQKLASVAISGGVTAINNYTFQSANSMAYFDFSRHTTVPTLSATNAITAIPSDCEIRVPAALVDEWKAATNWSTYASYIVGV